MLSEKQLAEIEAEAIASTPMEIPEWDWDFEDHVYSAHVESQEKQAASLVRARELIDADMKFLGKARKNVIDLARDIRRLRAVVEQYADRNNWDNSTFGLCWKDKWNGLHITRNGYEPAAECLREDGE